VSAAAPPPANATAKTVGWALVFYGGVQLVGYFLASNTVGAAAVQAALSEWGAGRLGVAWSDPLAKAPTWSAIGRRAATGAGLGFAVGALALVVLLVTHGATLSKGSPVVASLAVGLLTATLWAVRDELLLRGFVLRTLSGWPSPAVCALVCGAAAAAAKLGVAGTTPVEIAVAGVSGVAFAALWQKDRGAWLAVGANTAWIFTTRSLFHDALLDVRFSPTVWGGGDVEAAGSATVLAVLVPLALAAAAASYKAASASERSTPR
jgi:hypothetical protein